MAQPPLDVFGRNSNALKISGSGSKRMRVPSGSAVLPFFSFLSLPCLKQASTNSPVAVAADQEIPRERVDGLGADAVEADAELEDVVVVFGAGVDFGDAIHHFAQGDAAPEIADGHGVVLDGDLHFLAVAHDEFVNGVINDLLEQDVAAVVVMGAVADAADVHAGAQADVFQRGERLDFALVVNVFVVVSHSLKSQSKEYQGERVGCQVEKSNNLEANPYLGVFEISF